MKEITAKELEQKMNNGENVKIIDVREVEEVPLERFLLHGISH